MLRSKNRWRFRTWILAAIAIPAVADAGIQPQGIQPQGIQPQGIQPQGIQPQGIQPQGIQPQGIQPQGIQPQGIQPQGIQPQGIQPQGIQPQGIQPQGVALLGTDLLSGGGKGVMIKTVDLRGTTSSSGIEAHALTRIPTMSTGSGNYITVGAMAQSAVGHYAVAHLADATNALVTPAEDLDLFIADGMKDPMSNLFHRPEEQDNEDWVYQVYFFHKWSGQWISLCPYDAHTKMASAIAIPEGAPNEFFFACTATGVDSKCARGWGYRPWADTSAWVFSGGAWGLQTFSLKDYYDACTKAAMAGYCQDSKSYTKTGTLVDAYDTRQIIWPNSIENPFSALNPDSQWMMAQEYFITACHDPLDPNCFNPYKSTLKASALQRSRYKELSPSADCDDFAYVDRLEHDNIEDGRWASPLTNTPRMQVFSPTHCTHDEYTVKDDEPLPWDCSPCTTQVCKELPECCGAGLNPGWKAACKTKALAVCKTGADQWPAGRVWPAGVDTSGTKILPKYLFGPQGAVLRVDGTSGNGTSATVSGWACDPEWPDATVAVAIYDAPRETVEAPLAVVQADKAVAVPLAREVSAACDGPGRAYARHGFSYTLPANQSGNVFVYAIDRLTDDGKPAPDTLIRNGIVHVPRCAHSEHEAGAQLDQECSECAGLVCESDATCCSSSWTDACAQLANACTPTDSSAALNSRVYAAVTTGWVEAPADGTYTFDSSIQPSRLFINGTSVLDWFENPLGSKQGNIDLRAGQKYHLRWDRFQSGPPSGSGPGLTWQPPGAVGQVAIPSGNLYGIAPGGGTGLQARYVDGDTPLTGPITDPQIDINKDVQPPAPTPKQDLPTDITTPYGALWQGEVVPSFSDAYTFYIEGNGFAQLQIDGTTVSPITPAPNTAPGGCGHDLCELGDKLDLGCNTCVDKVCDKDPYCCNGGYLSYYSFDFVWDAKCVSEVNAYCGAGLCSTPPIASPGPKHVKLGPVTMEAGVRYQIRLLHVSDTTDKTMRLLWSSARQAKAVVPQFSLFPANQPAAGAGAGLNVTYFGTTTANNVVKPNLNDVVASGFVADFSLTPTLGQAGTPLIDVLAAPSDVSLATPPPPMVVRPRFDELESAATPQVEVIGIGGLPGGTVRIGLDSDPTVEVIASIGSDGSWTATVATGVSFGPQIIKLIQRAPGSTCTVPTDGECSYEITIPVNIVEPTDSTKAPEISSPTDPTNSPAAVLTSFAVKGQGTTADVHIVDQGMFPDSFPTPIKPASDGSFTGSIDLHPGDAVTPLKGWHKLVFDQGGLASHPVFVSVGIDPPTVEFPRNGAELSCDDSDQTEPPRATGRLAYPKDNLGELFVLEETGRDVLGEIGTKVTYPPVQPGNPSTFEAEFGDLGPGRHLLLFFQAPKVPPGTTREQHLRDFSSLANTPFSRIVVDVKPRRMQIPSRGPTIITPVPGQILPQVVLGANDCPGQSACALPGADVNMRVGDRVYTVRAGAGGNWNLTAPLSPGWTAVNVSQVVDSKVGGAWSESCPQLLNYGVRDPDGPTITPPNSRSVPATSAAGAVVTYGDATAKDAAGAPVPVQCLPASGSTFRIGVTEVLCTAVDNRDPNHPKVGLASFFVTVFDEPPIVQVSDLLLEADQPAGRELATYPILVSDVVDPHPMVVCIPPPPNLFLLDEVTPVTCEVTDSGHNIVPASFTVSVLDRTPPTLCELSDIMIGTNAGAGAIVKYATCADDIVDGTVPVVCDHPSGSFFPFGTTVVKCNATDKHGNRSSDSFTVSVGDTIPPVLKLPDVVTAFATSKTGAKVNYTVTATDNIDPNPKVKCTPPSGSQFPLGESTVTCKATDASNNTSQGTFKVRVIVKWSGLLPPIPADGTGVFKQGSTIPTKFDLVAPSDGICDLVARLYVAPVDAAGRVGPEKPAKSKGVGSGNTFAPTGNHYQLNLDTGPMAVGKWQLRVDLGDGEPHPTMITLR